MKILRALQIIKQDGGRVLSSTYNEVNDTGDMEKKNGKDSFYAIDAELIKHIEAIESYINTVRFGQEG